MLFLSGFEVYSRWVPLTVNNYLAVMLWFVLHTSMTVFFYDYGSCQASLNLLLISLAYLLTGKRYTSGESPNFGIEIFYGILRKFRRVAMVKWSLYSGRHDPWFAFQRLLLTSEQGWFFLMRLYFLTLLSKITEKNTPWGTMNLISSYTHRHLPTWPVPHACVQLSYHPGSGTAADRQLFH